jgi:hypothetical protein
MMNKLNITRVAIAASVSGALVVAAISFASGAKSTPAPAAAFTDPATLPKFANVQVVNATPEQIAALQSSDNAAQYAPGQRAYVDPVTKRLRPALPEELVAEAAAANSAASAAAVDPVVTTTADGVKRADLDETFMSYAVAHVEPDGSVKQGCVEHQPSEQAALQAVVASTGVDSNEK